MNNEMNRMEWKLKRISKGIKQKELAKQLQVSAALLSQFEQHKTNMNDDLIAKYQRIIEDKS
ncbi:helix-turn-helix transcriptional regulator [Paenibacillus campi]|uniref:helix-turn-helix domain-containing protein n=1 Tax=Paenibacillus campi TaxID=3106031 RepID=UPI002AFE1EE5|nr:helix-turn-helix transcriptional regulator [Paenibacillus sp. SGZ-1014]